MEINVGVEIKDFHDLQTHWNRKRDFTGRLTRISVQRSRGSRFDISVSFSSSPLGEDELRMKKKEKAKGNLCGKPKPKEKTQVFLIFFIYIEAFNYN
jgi:hypothetical protein